MAKISLVFFFFSLLFFLVLSSVDARPGLNFHPCKTFFVSTYSFSFHPSNPNFLDHPRLHLHHRHHLPEFFAFVAKLRNFDDSKADSVLIDTAEILPGNRRLFLNNEGEAEIQEPFQHRPVLPFGVSSSLYDRTMDILNVVASLLFGAACGALTAGTMYFIWSLFNNRHHDAYHNLDGLSSDDGDDDDDDIFNPKKPAGGYIAVPAGPPAATEEAAPAKETA